MRLMAGGFFFLITFEVVKLDTRNFVKFFKNECQTTPPTTPQTRSENHQEPRLQTHTIYMEESLLKSSV